ncbi:exodeoxyribonuclease VII small subunit [Pectinatus brassicae]|uniref:Exodeoxyribonuclease 7 small subunit n=1 Tax=Pectinatus brassicae TaxID=862415 RepID=A0A840UVB0_9FIRM|nr:exodeoxyribonuclease VII small subunit [Pectinatus brassicae]MBB5336385.1 exodeoxyribonuclease VII small subunit [Pectinatus brassicae]
MPRKKQNFEESVTNLEEVVAELEAGNLSLENILKKYKEATDLVTFCRSELDKADKTVCDLAEIDAAGMQKPLSIETKGHSDNE